MRGDFSMQCIKFPSSNRHPHNMLVGVSCPEGCNHVFTGLVLHVSIIELADLENIIVYCPQAVMTL